MLIISLRGKLSRSPFYPSIALQCITQFYPIIIIIIITIIASSSSSTSFHHPQE